MLKLVLVLASLAWPPPAFTTENVTWSNGDVRLAGTLYRPVGPGRHPAAIFIHGSGNMGRANDTFREHAERLASSGVAMLIYDKRGVGESTGKWQAASFDDLSRDAAGGIDVLRKHAAIDPARVGIFGLSQGAWISLRTQSLRPETSFIVWVTGAAVTPARQEEHVVSSRLAARGLQRDVPAALDLLRAAQSIYRLDRDWDRLAEHDATASRAPWYAVARIGIAKRTDAWWRWYAALMDEDPVPALSRLQIPLFAAFAGDDELVDSAESMGVLARLASVVPGGLKATVRRYDGVAHGLRDNDRRLAIPAEYWTDLTAFLAPFLHRPAG